MTNAVVAYTCDCPGDYGHSPGCLLALRLKIKYGDSAQGIMGVAESQGCIIALSEEALSLIDHYYEKLKHTWVQENRLTLAPAECGWPGAIPSGTVPAPDGQTIG